MKQIRCVVDKGGEIAYRWGDEWRNRIEICVIKIDVYAFEHHTKKIKTGLRKEVFLYYDFVPVIYVRLLDSTNPISLRISFYC